MGENVFVILRKKLEKIVKKVLTNGIRSGILSELSPRGAVESEGIEKEFRENRKKGLTKSGRCGNIIRLSNERPEASPVRKKILKKVEKST